MSQLQIVQRDERVVFENTVKILAEWLFHRIRRRETAPLERFDGNPGDLWEIELPKNSCESFRIKALLLDDGFAIGVKPVLWVSVNELWSILFGSTTAVASTLEGDFDLTIGQKMHRKWCDLTRNCDELFRRLKPADEIMINARGVGHLYTYSANYRPYSSLVFARMKALESMVSKRVKERMYES